MLYCVCILILIHLPEHTCKPLLLWYNKLNRIDDNSDDECNDDVK